MSQVPIFQPSVRAKMDPRVTSALLRMVGIEDPDDARQDRALDIQQQATDQQMQLGEMREAGADRRAGLAADSAMAQLMEQLGFSREQLASNERNQEANRGVTTRGQDINRELGAMGMLTERDIANAGNQTRLDLQNLVGSQQSDQISQRGAVESGLQSERLAAEEPVRASTANLNDSRANLNDAQANLFAAQAGLMGGTNAVPGEGGSLSPEETAQLEQEQETLNLQDLVNSRLNRGVNLFERGFGLLPDMFFGGDHPAEKLIMRLVGSDVTKEQIDANARKSDVKRAQRGGSFELRPEEMQQLQQLPEFQALLQNGGLENVDSETLRQELFQGQFLASVRT